MRKLTRIMVTGGAGFIGSNFIRYLFALPDFTGTIVNVDKLTYAGNLENLADIDEQFGGKRYFFERADICSFEAIKEVFERHEVDAVVHFAAESHVDRSIFGPKEFIQSNILGTFTLLEVARLLWQGKSGVLFHHVSTDEVFGSLGSTGAFTERTPYNPKSPYSASKAASDHLVRAYHHTYGLPATVSNCSNNFGPYQFPEKLIPLMILNLLDGRPLPVYGDGKNVRDWLFVDDHSAALWLILNKGVTGETYNIGGENELENLELIYLLCEKIAAIKGQSRDALKKLISFVKDRPGHDRRYAIDCRKIKKALGWSRKFDFSESLEKTIVWYMKNPDWVQRVRSGEYRSWIEKNYEKR